MSYDDVVSLVEHVHQFVGRVNAQQAPNWLQESLRLDSPLASITLRNDFSHAAFRAAPPVSYSAFYLYEARHAPISRIELSLDDARREIGIEGEDEDQVAALRAFLSEQLGQFETSFGGMGFRLIGLFVLMIAFWTLIFFGIDKFKAGYQRAGFALACVVVFVSIFLFPWDRWLRGVAIYAGDASFIVRHSAAISCTGTVGSLVALASPLVSKFR